MCDKNGSTGSSILKPRNKDVCASISRYVPQLVRMILYDLKQVSVIDHNITKPVLYTWVEGTLNTFSH